MKRLLTLFISSLLMVASAHAATEWTEGVKIDGFKAIGGASPYLEIYFTGKINSCSYATAKRKTTFTATGDGKYQELILMTLNASMHSSKKIAFAKSDQSVCDSAKGLTIFGVKTVTE